MKNVLMIAKVRVALSRQQVINVFELESDFTTDESGDFVENNNALIVEDVDFCIDEARAKIRRLGWWYSCCCFCIF
jgi:hypothetical protein